MASSTRPKYVYKIIPAAPPNPIPDEYPLSELDQKDGFVHLSTASQIPTTASLFFSTTSSLWVLKLRFTFAEDKVTYENGAGCPHLHGNFGAGDVEDAREFVRAEGEVWEAAFGREGAWLV